MELRFITGDLRGLPIDIVIHQCNCQGVMGAGIAKSLVTAYPDLRLVDHSALDQVSNPKELLGDFSALHTQNLHHDRPISIVNCYSQLDFREPNNKTDLVSLKAVFNDVGYYAKRYKLTLGFPRRLGSGLAQGNSTEILNTITETLNRYDIVVYVVDFELNKFTL